ncbi:MAG: hypothetical protein KA297_09125 [Kofleriaceae bacterium]|nr:hypothetical protein [Kofleriaceae bacterium]MBP6836385.1 hypothetical protein [Kofleriaceae bacterium]
MSSTHLVRLALAAALAGAMVLTAPVERAEACSCAAPGDLGLLDPGPEVPLGTRGLLWAGRGTARPRDFAITTTRGGKRHDVPVTLVPVGTWGEGTGRWNLVLVRPGRPLLAGVSYRFTTRRFDHDRSPSGGARVVTVQPGPAVLPASLNTTIGPVTSAGLEVISLAGDCSHTIDASQAKVEVVLPPALEPYRGQLLYRTFVDGKPWQPRTYLCAANAPGRSWQPTAGTDLVYSACDRSVDGPGLEAGVHEVSIEVAAPTLADGYQVRTTPASVRLGCVRQRPGRPPRRPPSAP